jgi:chorismate mutase
MSTTVRAVRGAISCDADTVEAINGAAVEVVTTMLTRNNLAVDDVISIFFTNSPDLISGFPATGVRLAGFEAVPLMCASEINVPGAMTRIIRVLMHVHTSLPRTDIKHVFLGEARALRSDLD